MKKIESNQNKIIKWVTKLISDSKQRKNENLAVCETYKIFTTLVESNKDAIVCIICTSEFCKEHSREVKKFYDKVHLVDNHLFSQISNLKTPDGIMVVFKYFNKEVDLKQKNYSLALVDIQNPSNLGAIIRSSLAFSINNIFLIGNCCDLYHPDVIRSSMGYVFGVNITKYKNFDYFLANARTNKIEVVATSLTSNAKSLKDINLSDNTCIILGNEGNGLDPTIVRKCDQVLKIDLSNEVQSLNVAVATGIICYHIKHENNRS